MTSSPTDPMIGRLLDGRYQVRSRIARGGMATVYVATDLRLERRVAVKVMHGHLADDSAFRDRFIQEARSAARLAHPNVVNVFDQGQDSDMAYLVMEYLPGMTLRELLQEYERLTPEQTLDILEAVLSGLAAAHKAGIVHRDLKPENVLLADDGRIKIGDFGLARAVSANTATGQALLGTIAYLSPELVTRGIADTRSDIYAVGIMMYEMLAGEQPFKGEQPMQIAYQHANDQVPTPSIADASVPVELDELVLWATARDPEQRPRDARALLDELYAVQNRLDARSGDPAPLQRTVVFPSAPALPPATTGETQVVGGPPVLVRQEPERSEPDSVVALAAAGSRRRARGWVLALLIVMLAALAGGTGWYYGQGPGARVPVPQVSAMAVDDAAGTLQGQGFVVARAEEPSVDVAVGRVTRSVPASGTPVDQGSTVTVYASTGPQLLDVPDVVGASQDDARKQLEGVPFVVQDATVRQYGDQPEGTVVQVLDAAGAPVGAQYPEQQPVTLVVAAGRIPDVNGRSVDQAVATLAQAGLVGEAGKQSFSDDVDKGEVISVYPLDQQPVRSGLGDAEGSKVGLEISKGPDLVAVPQVVDLTRDEAKAALDKAGFKYAYSAFWDALPNSITRVASASPEAQALARRGSTVNLGITASG
ncbi:Stk1 family PASTA domain-containing Ser/Thr kinase [Clavibacter zhangzhiyongii]|uniref:Stk1 family PASTA domain-containing Ser/Thr kinase n=1 Tax=Clavibacter zhangzhiyongii TaxID=2768071 RepID=UPI00195BAFEE|nr:Stk1 family PASTA domain-containing Ser/Thr kinase [Clavibacter zhangzhiyongii]MBM7024796.1 Stk1 family PASTA domain-containing Ser/Thr kinase [Clavibacter zhangzhiyongii]